ncbi:unnamed protein product, partial [Polarella glacialis]
ADCFAAQSSAPRAGLPRAEGSRRGASALRGLAGDGLVVAFDTREDFEANLDGPVTVAMFSSPMCGPCLLVEPKITEMALDLAASGVKIIKLSLTPGKNAQSLKPLFSELEVRELPTFVVYKDGEIKGRVTGTSHVELRELITGLI